jgi:kynurenine formamidase
MGRFIELSHPIVEGMETYRPLPTPRVEVLNDYDASRYEGKSEFLIASLHLCGNTGTYVDSPKHRFRNGVDLAGLELERLADLEIVVVDATRIGRAIGPGALHQRLEREGPAFPHRLLAPLGHRELLHR